MLCNIRTMFNNLSESGTRIKYIKEELGLEYITATTF